MTVARTVPEVRPEGAARRSTWHDMLKARWAYLFIAPFYVSYAIFGLYPLLFSVYLSLSNSKGLATIKFVGLDNFRRLTLDSVFWQSMKNGVHAVLPICAGNAVPVARAGGDAEL